MSGKKRITVNAQLPLDMQYMKAGDTFVITSIKIAGDIDLAVFPPNVQEEIRMEAVKILQQEIDYDKSLVDPNSDFGGRSARLIAREDLRK